MFKKIKNKVSFPFIRQAHMMECGSTCLAIIFKFYGLENVRSLLRELAEVSASGTSLLVMKNIATKFGFDAQGYKVTYDNLSELHLPCIAHYEGNHFIVIYEKHKDYVKVADPAVGKLKIERKEFESRWNGLVLNLIPTVDLFKDTEIQDKVKKSILTRKETIKVFYRSVFRGLKRNFFEILIGSILIQLTALAIPLFTQVIINKILAQQLTQLLYVVLISLGVVFFMQILLSYGRNILIAQFGVSFEYEFFRRFFEHFLKMEQRFFDSFRREDLIHRFKENLRIREVLSPAVLDGLIGLPMLPIYFFVLFLYHAKLALLAFVIVVVYVIVIMKITPKLIYWSQKVFNENGKIMGKFLDTIIGIQNIKLLNAEFVQSWRWQNDYQKNLNYALQSKKLVAQSMTILNAVFFLGQISVYWLGAYLTFNGELTIGAYVAFVSIFMVVMNQVRTISSYQFLFTELSVVFESVHDILVEKVEEDSFNTHGLEAVKSLSARSVNFSYNANMQGNVLSDINFKVEKGQFVGVVGRNGSGKSTLVKLISKLYTSYSGGIYINDTEIRGLNTHAYREKVFMIPQEVEIFNDSIKNNIIYGLLDVPMERVIEAAKLADIHDFIKDHHLGYNLMIGEGGTKLSGGQKLKIAFARLFVRNPEIIILDEASSALDIESEKIIMDNILSKFNDKTIISIAHRLSTLKRANKIWVMDNGTIVEEGPHDQLMDNKESIYYGFMNTYVNY